MNDKKPAKGKRLVFYAFYNTNPPGVSTISVNSFNDNYGIGTMRMN